jgi:hypothetical protein
MESLIAPVKHNGPCDNISAPSGTLDHRQKETTMPVTVILEHWVIYERWDTVEHDEALRRAVEQKVQQRK